jgi:hypothetical protein
MVGGSHAAAHARPGLYTPVASAPSSDAWNLPKRI